MYLMDVITHIELSYLYVSPPLSLSLCVSFSAPHNGGKMMVLSSHDVEMINCSENKKKR